jgi:PPK2 family polyphosphate:nucleotide phosphotransferase
MDTDRFRVRQGDRVKLDRWSTKGTPGAVRASAKRLLQENVGAIAVEQDRLYAQDRYALLVIFQAMDAAGKDSTIKHVMSGVNPQGVHVTSFKVPTTHELDHDYLWRSALALPERGMIGIHNRSHYEEVLAVKVHPEFLDGQHLPDTARGGNIWKRRYRQINQFERHLVENGTAVVKFFLHVSKDEQRRRFLERIDTPEKNWKFSLRDVKERESWKDYQKAYEEALTQTSTKRAPWYVIPADNKWYMQLVVGRIIVDTLEKLKLEYPRVDEARRRELAEARVLLVKEGKS